MVTQQNGQSILEVVLSIGLISLVTAGVVMLLSSTLGARTKETDRKKAVEISQTVMEDLLQKKTDIAIQFWDIGSMYWQNVQGVSQTLAGYPDYNYIVNITQDTRAGCSSTTWECANVSVTVGFAGTADKAIFTRFFTKR